MVKKVLKFWSYVNAWLLTQLSLLDSRPSGSYFVCPKSNTVFYLNLAMVDRIWPSVVSGEADSVSSGSAAVCHIGGPKSVHPGQILLVYGTPSKKPLQQPPFHVNKREVLEKLKGQNSP